MTKKPQGFFAYAARPTSAGDCIEPAIVEINNGGSVNLRSWKENQVNGRIILNKIIQAIDQSDFVCADLTGLNDNVLFEIGYAIVKRKPLFLINDVTHSDSFRRYSELGLLTTIGYSSYTKSSDIVQAFYVERPDTAQPKLWDDLLELQNPDDEKKALLILNGQVDTNYNQEVVNQADYYRLPFVLDDASESKVQSLSWYATQLMKVPAVVVQFSSTARSGHELHNAKCAFISGLAFGLDLRLKMIAENPYTTPMDYRELLRRFSNRKECGDIVGEFLDGVQLDIAGLLLQKSHTKDRKKRKSQFQRISFGEIIAEHESDVLAEYFVETAQVQNLVKNEYNIIVGRKGTGKTATLYYLNDTLGGEKINHVCLIKPINFEVDGLVTLMNLAKNEFEQGFMVESLWKFLIYTEVCRCLYAQWSVKKPFAITDNEQEFLDYVSDNKNLFLTDLSSRMDEQIQRLIDADVHTVEEGRSQHYKLRVSEILHDGILAKTRSLIIRALPKGHRVYVLIDNLDKSWRKEAQINVLSKYILGLLGVSGRIVQELAFSKTERTGIAFHLTIFLRSDIFRYVMKNAREPDKIEVTKLLWKDKESLFRVVEERFVTLSEDTQAPSELWSNYVCKSVDGELVKDYIFQRIIPRPRDVIWWMKAAKDLATFRGHDQIEEADIVQAYKDYSTWVFKSMIVENGITQPQMEAFMYELMTGNAILSRAEIQDCAVRVGIDVGGEEALALFINHLTDLTIFGREVRNDEYEYEYDVDDQVKIRLLSEKLGTGRYKLHPALVPYLECKV